MTVDAQILFALRNAAGGAVSGADLAQRLGISRAAVWTHIEELRRLGYDIAASPHHGYTLLGHPDALHADDLLARLSRNRIVGRDIRVFQRTASTNDIVEKLARDGAPEGVVVFAEAQSKGRGRLGRTWFSPPGKGLWFSVLLRPDLRPRSVTRLTVAAATALVRAIRQQTNLQPEIKWPNDVLVNGRKAIGILTELSAEVDRVKHVTLGVGVDVNQTTHDFPSDLRKAATSLAIECGRKVDRPELATAILKELDRDYARVVKGEFSALAEEWERHCATVGRSVRIQLGGRTLTGRAESLDDDGALLLRTEHGHLERVTGGDVTLER